MDRPLPEAPTLGRRLLGGLSLAVPVALGGASLAVAGREVFPVDPGPGALLMCLGAAGAIAALLPRPSTAHHEPVAEVSSASDVVDFYSGLPNALLLPQLLQREIGRSARYGDRTFLAVVEAKVFGLQPLKPGEAPPSHGKYIASMLLAGVRQTDTVLRLDTHRFALLLTECDQQGAEVLFGRLRTRIGTTPFARNSDGSGIYARAWCGGVPWTADITSPDEFLAAALAEVERSRAGYESQQRWFAGTQPQRGAS